MAKIIKWSMFLYDLYRFARLLIQLHLGNMMMICKYDSVDIVASVMLGMYVATLEYTLCMYSRRGGVYAALYCWSYEEDLML